MCIVFHETIRGIKVTRYSDDKGSFGFCGRAAYAMGLDRPNYPVPAKILRVWQSPATGLQYVCDMNDCKHTSYPTWSNP